jgi:hypothetical protein
VGLWCFAEGFGENEREEFGVLVANGGILPLESTVLLSATLLNNRSVRAEVRYGNCTISLRVQANHSIPTFTRSLSGQIQMDANWSPDGKSLLFDSFIFRNEPIYSIDSMTKRVPLCPVQVDFFSPLVAGSQAHCGRHKTSHVDAF